MQHLPGVDVKEYRSKEKVFKEYGKKFFDSSPDDLKAISDRFVSSSVPAERGFAEVLGKLQDASDSRREAVLFGLWQQPAFRKSVYRLKKLGLASPEGLPESGETPEPDKTDSERYLEGMTKAYSSDSVE